MVSPSSPNRSVTAWQWHKTRATHFHRKRNSAPTVLSTDPAWKGCNDPFNHGKYVQSSRGTVNSTIMAARCKRRKIVIWTPISLNVSITSVKQQPVHGGSTSTLKRKATTASQSYRERRQEVPIPLLNLIFVPSSSPMWATNCIQSIPTTDLNKLTSNSWIWSSKPVQSSTKISRKLAMKASAPNEKISPCS